MRLLIQSHEGAERGSGASDAGNRAENGDPTRTNARKSKPTAEGERDRERQRK